MNDESIIQEFIITMK